LQGLNGPAVRPLEPGQKPLTPLPDFQVRVLSEMADLEKNVSRLRELIDSSAFNDKIKYQRDQFEISLIF
jgi:hypothetical protein